MPKPMRHSALFSTASSAVRLISPGSTNDSDTLYAIARMRRLDVNSSCRIWITTHQKPNRPKHSAVVAS